MADSPSAQSALQLSRDFAALIAAAAPSVAAVHGRGRRPSSGLIWQPGLVISAEETVERDTGLALTLPDGRRVDATLVGRDPTTDIALLRYTVDFSRWSGRPWDQASLNRYQARPSRRCGWALR